MSVPKGDLVDAAAEAMRQRRFGEAIGLLEEHLQSSPQDLRATMRLGICHLLNRSEKVFLEIHEKVKHTIKRMADIPEDVRRLWTQYAALVRKVTGTALLIGATSLAGCSSRPESARPASSDGVREETAEASPERERSVVPDDPAERGRSVVPDDSVLLRGGDIQSAHKYSGGVFKPPVVSPGDSADPGAKLGDSKDSNDPYARMTAEEIRAAIARLEKRLADAQPAPEGDTVSAHRYSGGVYIAPRAIKIQIEALKRRLAELEAGDAAQGNADEGDKVQSSHRYSGGVFVAPRRDGR